MVVTDMHEATRYSYSSLFIRCSLSRRRGARRGSNKFIIRNLATAYFVIPFKYGESTVHAAEQIIFCSVVHAIEELKHFQRNYAVVV